MKKGVSPVIATVLLVAMVLVIAAIIFIWVKGMQSETCTKFDGTNVEIVCGQAEFIADYTGNVIQVSNTGNVPIFNMKIKVEKEGSYETIDLRDNVENEWPSTGLSQGGAFSSPLTAGVINGAESITLIPVLMSTCSGKEKAYTCDDKQYGYEIAIY